MTRAQHNDQASASGPASAIPPLPAGQGGELLFPFGPHRPLLGTGVFLAPGCRLIGAVSLGDQASVWYNAVIRADLNPISIGAASNIQDLAVLHVAGGEGGALTIGSEVVVGHGAILHACTIGDRVLIGMGATVLDGALVESGCIIAAGAVVTPGTRVPAGSLWAGVPARPLRRLDGAAIEDIAAQARRYVELARQSAEALGAPA